MIYVWKVKLSDDIPILIFEDANSALKHAITYDGVAWPYSCEEDKIPKDVAFFFKIRDLVIHEAKSRGLDEIGVNLIDVANASYFVLLGKTLEEMMAILKIAFSDRGLYKFHKGQSEDDFFIWFRECQYLYEVENLNNY